MSDDTSDLMGAVDWRAFEAAEARIYDSAVPVALLEDDDLEEFGVPGASRAERERWVAETRSIAASAQRRAARKAVDPGFAAHAQREAAVWAAQAGQRMRKRPQVVRRALRRVRGRPACARACARPARRGPRRSARRSPCPRSNTAQANTAQGDDDDGDGDGEPAGPPRGRRREETR